MTYFQVYAFFDSSKSDAFSYKKGRYIRVEIDDIKNFNNQNVYIMWATDYGKPLQTKNPRLIKDLPEKFVNFDTKIEIYEGILDVLPAKKVKQSI